MRLTAPQDACPPPIRVGRLRWEAAASTASHSEGASCHRSRSPTISRPGWAAGAQATARPPSSAGSRSSSSPSCSACRSATKHDQQRRQQHRPGPQGRPHPQGRRLRQRQAVRGVHPRPVEDAHGLRPGLQGGRPRRDRSHGGHARGRSRPLAVRPEQREADHEGRPRRLRRVLPRGRPGRRLQGRRQGPRRRRQGAEGQPRLLDPRDRRRERGQGTRRHVQQAAGAGGRALAPAHADHPARRVRRDRRGGDPAAPGDLGRARDARAARTPEPPDPDGPVRVRGRPARRARGRRRLLALLPQA